MRKISFHADGSPSKWRFDSGSTLTYVQSTDALVFRIGSDDANAEETLDRDERAQLLAVLRALERD